MSLLYDGDVNVEEVGGMADHGPVNVVVLFLVLGKELFWGGWSGVEEGGLYLRSWVRHVMYVELVGVELIIMRCVVPDDSSKVYWGV